MTSVDVIVPCYRYAHYLRQCVESVLAQHGPTVRVLILDDASPDETPEVAAGLIRQDSRVAYVRHERTKGHIATYNAGIDWISSDYYLLLSADDHLLPGALSRAATLLDESPHMSFVFGNAVADMGGTHLPIRPFAGESSLSGSRTIRGAEFIAVSRASNIVPTPTAVVRVTAQKECGGYRPDFPHAGDMEMWFRLAAMGDVGFVDADQAVYRKHGKNMSEAYIADHWIADIEQRSAVLKQFFSSHDEHLPGADELRKQAFSALASDALGHASEAFNAGKAELSRQLMECALALSDDARSTSRWRNLALKRMMGTGLWRIVNAVRLTVRSDAKEIQRSAPH